MTGPERQAEVDEYNQGWGIFEEDRYRDPAWLTAETTKAPLYAYTRAECCHDEERYVVEIPRSRMHGSKVIELNPAKFRLCYYHAGKVEENDPEATFYEIGRDHERRA